MIAIPALDFGSIDLDAFRRQLREIISVFREIDQPLQHRVIDFLIEGHDSDLLLDVREALRKPNRPKFFRQNEPGLTPIDFKLSCHLLRLFNPPVAPAGYYQRLGQVCSQHPDLERSQTQPDQRLPKWFNDLLRFALSLKLGAPFSIPHAEQKCDFAPALSSLTGDERDQLLRILLEVSYAKPTQLAYRLSHLISPSHLIEQHFDRLMVIVRTDEKLHEPLVRLFENTLAEPGRYFGEIIDYGLVISRKSKSSFQSVLERHRAAAKPILLERLASGTPEQRMRAAEWLNKLFGQAIADALSQALSREPDRKVRAVIEPLVAVYREAADYERSLAQALTLPPLEMPAGELPLPAGFTKKFQAFLDEARLRSREQYKAALHDHALHDQTAVDSQQQRVTPPSSDDLLALYLFMEGKSPEKPPKNEWLFRVLQQSPAIESWCDPQRLHLVQVMRLLDAIGSLQERSSALAVYHFNLLNAHRMAQATPYGLREIDAAAEQLIGRPHLMSRGFLLEPGRYLFADEDIWPAFVDQLKLLEDSIAGVPLDQYDRDVLGRRKTALAIAGMLPVLPKQLEEAAWKLALGEAWTLRPLARPLLKRQPDCVQRAIAALSQRSCGAKMGAAELLQELGAVEAVEPLKKALRKEKFKPVQGQLLTALEKLGGSVDEFIGRDKLLQDATVGVKRPPRSMMWFPMDKLPVVRWSSDNKPLEPIILRWWLIQCVEFKSTTCSPIMRRALELCRRDDTLRLAHFILDTWINFDTDEPDRAELEKRIRGEAARLVQAFALSGKKISFEDQVSRMVTEEMRGIQRAQSAHTERGMLGIVAAFGDDKCVEKIEKYIRNYHGNRALQAKSMLEVIPQIDAPISLRVVRSLAAGFRNAAICKRAGELLREMAERYGWSEDELAERVLPDAGFALLPTDSGHEVQPQLCLSYGRRQFRVTLDDELTPIVMNADGTRLKDLPATTKDDDKAIVRVAKEQLKSARRILQSTKEELTGRMYQAMCSGRSWKFSDWRELLAGHALAGILCRRLVWAACEKPDGAPEFFQLMNAGELVDAAGQRLQLADDALISVAHPDQMDQAIEQFWEDHLASQGIRPLFAQTSAALREESPRAE